MRDILLYLNIADRLTYYMVADYVHRLNRQVKTNDPTKTSEAICGGLSTTTLHSYVDQNQ